MLSLAGVLGIPAGDLSAITGIGLPEEPLENERLVVEMADLLWNCRRLSAAQVEQLYAEAKAVLVPIPDGSDRGWNRVHHAGGVWWGAPRDPDD